MTWAPNYTQEFMERRDRLIAMHNNPGLILGAKEYYKDKAIEFIEDWGITYDPRNAKTDSLPTVMPFKLFDRQKDFVNFLISCLEDEESGLVEKSRDIGATWICCSVSVWLWLFYPGASVGWGSRKEQLVDKLGDPDSIFEKLRMIIEELPPYLLPIGYSPRIHCSFMKIINPENGATITGEAGNNIGRGGRKLIYFKDESAHYEQPEKIEAALGDNTRVQIDISSVNGTANVFARKRQAGTVWAPGVESPKGALRVFIFDWRDNPLKNQEWYDARRKKAESEGLLHVFAQEVDRDYAAAVEGIIIPSHWAQAAVDLHNRITNVNLEEGKIRSALDVADEGGDVNAQAMVKGITLIDLDMWGQGDTGQTANKALLMCKNYRAVELDYDCIGVGAGVKAELNRLGRESKLPKYLTVTPWNAADAVIEKNVHVVPGDPDTPLNKDLFANFKSQSWWRLRIRFEKTWKYVTQGIVYPIDELINIRSDIPYFHEIMQQISQPTYSTNNAGKILVNKKPDGTRSPNLGDATNMAFNPARKKKSPVWGK